MYKSPASTVIVGLVLAAAAASASAADDDYNPYKPSGVYGSVAGGGNYTHDQELNGNGAISFDGGGLGLAAIGGHLPYGLRPELEYAYRRNDANNSGSGHETADTGMANLWYDFAMPSFAPRFVQKLRPFVGGGLGEANVRLDRAVDATGAAVSGDDSVFAWQAGAGVGYDVTRNLALSLGYRYLDTKSAHFSTPPAATGLGGTTPGRTYDASYRSDGVLAGLTYSFGRGRSSPMASSAAPAETTAMNATPGPQPAEAAAFETVTLRPINFRFDSADLTAPSQAMLDELAQHLSAHPGMKVTIEGYADAIGTPDYNKRLGEKRAEAVKGYLSQKGVKAENLEVASGGESNPIASNQTPQGRAENRRTEFNATEPSNVKIVIEGPSKASVDAAQKGGSAGSSGASQRQPSDQGGQ